MAPYEGRRGVRGLDNATIDELIQYLLRREFGSLHPPAPPVLAHVHNASFDARERAERRYKRVNTKRAEYKAMPEDEVRAIAAEAQITDAAVKAARINKDMDNLFFNRPGASADLGYFAKLATWSLEEAVALSLGKDPRVVSRQAMESGPSMSEVWSYAPFPLKYSKRSEIVRRAMLAHTLDDPTRPAAFLTWARIMDMSVPDELETEVAKRTPIADLQKELEAAKARVVELERELAEANNAAAHQWPWGTYETSLLRHLAAAGRRYWVNYDPADPSSAETNTTVSAWLEDQGVSKRAAEVMAQILRADGIKPGPRS